MADISKIQIQNATYDVKDETARNDIADLQLSKNFMNNKKIILVGDSYGQGYTPDGNVESWCEKFKTILGLSNSNCEIIASGGCGFGRLDHYFPDLIQNHAVDNTITDVIVLGGYNDIDSNYQNINNGIIQFKNYVNQKFVNANLHIGMVGWSNDPAKLYNLMNVVRHYINSCKSNNIQYLNNMQYSLHNYFQCFSSDGFHPNATGQEQIAKNLVSAFNSRNANVVYPYADINATYSNSFTGTNLTGVITMTQTNENVLFSIKSPITLQCSERTINCNNTLYEFANITNGLVIGNNYYTTIIPINTVIKHDGVYYDANAILVIANKKLFIAFYKVNDQGNNFFIPNKVTEILIQPSSSYIDARIN